MAEVLDELGCPREVTKEEVVSAFLQEVWDDVILGKVLACVSDPSERCRELAIQLIREVAQSLTEVDCTLKKTVPVMEERMGNNQILP